MLKRFCVVLSALVLSFNVLAADTKADESSTLPKIEDGQQYVKLSNLPSPEREVIELFSFNCPSCYRIEEEFKIPQTIRDNLPEGVKFKRYSLNSFGKLGNELSEAWAIANVLGIEDAASDALYTAVQKDRTINSEDDIKEVFANLGVDENKYDEMKNNFLVKAFIVQQNQAVKELKPASIPSFYVNGQYVIEQAGLIQSTKEELIKDYSRVANYLTTLKD